MAVTGVGSGLSLNAGAQTYYKKMALDNLEANLYFQQLAKHDSISANSGLTWNAMRYSKIASSTTVIPSEGTVPSETVLSVVSSSVTLGQYGQWVLISDLAIKSHRDTVIPSAVKELSYTGAKSIDEVVRTSLSAGTNYFANSVAALSDMFTTDTLDAEDIRKIVSNFGNNDVRPFDGGAYVGVYSHYQTFDLKGDTAGGGFVDISKYNNADKLYNGEIGKMWNMRILETSQITSTTAGTSAATQVYTGYALGANAVMDVDLASMPFEVFVKGLGSAGADDPLNQKASVGYKFLYGALYVGTDGPRCYKVQSAASYNG
jgi:N4-gp56 family major capsid protein